MNLLAFDTSTEALSVAVAGKGVTFAQAGEGGAKASATLIPTVLALLQQAGLALPALDAIVFGSGPGSFTGLRTACSVAQGLALGAAVPVLPVETLMAVAEEARERAGAHDVLALLDARMDEVYAARYTHDGRRWHREGPVRLAAPEAVGAPEGIVLAGNVFRAYGDRLAGGAARIEALPTAAALLRLAPALLADGEGRPAEEALPLYVRDKVAQTTAERAAARQDRMAP
ncbi:tRNA (adenosine(37)-N6)-threonylcarbamoyltransferase complex dimerization subunit type 1 TsaB [Ramlibacter sp. MMS24-I3-19]|uniref:tRNA (adenosine(37)-N6)-threonylcarbamoyltransferase complex dimerization subunit type 1 TsaB n=1 Tax=Ramlibacter sp. MMS24-I3-19 TaxID=3416606 RepID=UPI003CFD048B